VVREKRGEERGGEGRVSSPSSSNLASATVYESLYVPGLHLPITDSFIF